MADPARVPDPTPIERGFFREAEDGTTVFFPWGLTRRGYRLPGEAERARAARAATGMIGATVGIASWAAAALQRVLESDTAGASEALATLARPTAALATVILLYALWAWHFVEGLSESDLQISREARMREAAEMVAPWKVALIGGVTGVLGAVVVWIEPRQAWIGLLAVALGLGLVFWSTVLRRAARSASG